MSIFLNHLSTFRSSMVAIASNPNTPPERLTEMFDNAGGKNEASICPYPTNCFPITDTQVDVLQAIASNPNTPLNILWELASLFPAEVSHNAVLPMVYMEDPLFFARVPRFRLTRILETGKCPDWFVNAIADYLFTVSLGCVFDYPEIIKTNYPQLWVGLVLKYPDLDMY